jgi:hypothetical protein
MSLPLIDTSDVSSCAYGVAELQPGSSMKVARLPGTTHSLKSMMCGWLFTASPGWSDEAGMVCEMSDWKGASSHVTRPGAGRPHAHETRPEQSDRYGFQAGSL